MLVVPPTSRFANGQVNSQTLSTFTCVSGYGFSLQVSNEFDIRVRKFLNPLCSGIMWMLNPDNFLSSDVARSNPVLYREYCITASSTHALLPIFPEESWVLGWIQIRVGYVWTGKFDLKMDTCGRGNFWIRKEKVVESQISDMPFQAAIFKSKT